MGDAGAQSHTSGAAYGRDAEDGPKRQSGIEVVGAIPWGTHFCHFYETGQDLVDILVPYFREGLAANEFCMWITSAPLQVEEAKAALRAAVPDLDRRIDDGQIEILDYSDWYTRSGEFRADEVLQGWVKKLEAALRRGYEGLRLSGNTFWLGPAAWDDFTSYEEKVNNVIGRHRMLAICTYSLEKCGGREVADVVANHEFALIKHTGRWQIIESSHHRLTQAALRASEQRLSRAQEIAHLGSWELDVANNRLTWSDEVYRIFGLEPQEFGATYEAFLERVHPDDRAAVDAAYFGSIREGRDNYEIKHRVVRKGTGEIRWVHEKCEHVRDESGRIVRSIGMVHDITERKIADRRIADLARFPAENPSPVMRIDARGKLLHANSASDFFLRKWGVKEGESVPQEWRSRVEEALSAGTATSVETESEGRIYALTIAPVADSGYANLYVTDVTERRAAEEALRRSHENLEERVRERTAELDQIFHTAASGMRVVDKEFTILRANRTLLDMMGLPEEEVVGRKCHEVFRSDRCETPGCPLTRILAGDARVEFDVEKQRKDGMRIPCIVTAMPFRAPGGELLGMVEDIWDGTERKRLEAQLLQSQKMEAIGRLAGGIAHDFNNMMQVVTGYAHRMLRELEPDDPERKSVEEIEKAGERAAALTRQLLALGRRQVLQPKVLDLNAAISGIESMLRRTLGDDMDLVMVLQPDVGRVKVDPTQLEQVIVNLAINARDAMPGGGRLTVETANVHLGQDYPRDEAAVLPGEYVMMAVSDTGCGMGEETQAQVFDPFFTTKKPGEGTGLGLSTVYGTVRQSGGVIRVYSEPRKGTTFKIYLPRVDDAAEAEISRQPAEEASGGSETILLVEDDDNVRGLIAVELRERGYTVLEACNGSSAILKGRVHEGPIDLLVTDVMLPGRSGREVYEGVQAVHRAVRVLFISGHTEKHIVHRGVLDPGTCFLEKPFTDDQLAAKVREALDWARTAGAEPAAGDPGSGREGPAVAGC